MTVLLYILIQNGFQGKTKTLVLIVIKALVVIKGSLYVDKKFLI